MNRDIVETLGRVMGRKICIYGGTFNPIHNRHLEMARAAKEAFSLDEVWLLPSGTPPHKVVDGEVSARDRAAMCRLAVREYFADKSIVRDSNFPVAGFDISLSSEMPVNNRSGIRVCDLELGGVNPNYSYQTVSYLANTYPDDRFYFLIGEDSLRYFHNWVHPEIIAKNATILVVPRGETAGEKAVKTGDFIGKDQMSLAEMISYLKETCGGEYEVLPLVPDQTSSSDVRKMVYSFFLKQAGEIAFRERLSGFVPSAVSDYIIEHGLYRPSPFAKYDKDILSEDRHSKAYAKSDIAISSDIKLKVTGEILYNMTSKNELEDNTIKDKSTEISLPEIKQDGGSDNMERASVETRLREIEKELKKTLKPSRYRHTIGVMHTAASLAMAHSYPLEHAMVAGLLHDCTKYLSDEEQIAFCEKHHIEITASERVSPHLLHAKTGAYRARNHFGVTDAAIIHAIEVHTTGVPQMSLLDKILFVADYIEPNRNKQPRLREVREKAFSNLDLCVTMILSDTVNYLTEKAQSMDERTLESLAYYSELIFKKTVTA